MKRPPHVASALGAVVVVVTAALAGCGESRPASAPGAAPAIAAPVTSAGAPSSPSSSSSADPVAAAAARPATSGDVARTIDDWHDAAAHADEERYFAHLAEGAVFLGTDGRERWTLPELRAYAHPRFAAGKAWSFRATRREITFLGDTAWFDEDLDTPNLGPARGTGVLVRSADGRWKIAQYNLSVPIPNERFAEVRAAIAADGATDGRPGRTSSAPAAGPSAGKLPPRPPSPPPRPVPPRDPYNRF